LNILLVNKSIVISRLVTICIKDIGASLDEIDDISNLRKDNYDVIIVDEQMDSKELNNFIDTIKSKSKIILYSDANANLYNYDIKIKKPFLPQKLTEILSDFITTKDKEEIAIDNYFFKELLSMPSSKIKEVLAGAEITIKIKFPKESK